MNKKTVVVIGRNYTSRLGMIRAAGMAGYDVIVIKTDKKSGRTKGMIDVKSKYVKSYYWAPQPDRNKLVELLLCKIKKDYEKLVLLPTDDYSASTLDMNYDVLSEYFFMPNIEGKQNLLIQYMDKNLQKEMAEKSGILVAKGWTANYVDTEYQIPTDVVFPCFIKPQVSIAGSKSMMKRCNTYEELKNNLAICANTSKAPILIEEYLEIEKEYAILGYCNHDKVIMPALLEMITNHMGVIAEGLIHPMEKYENLSKSLVEFLKQFNFVGLFDVDLIEANGNIYFNELNLRFGASGYAVTLKGINLPEMFIRDLYGEPIAVQNQSIVKESRFANEKVCFQEYTSGTISWKEFWNIINSTNECFVKCKNDPAPFKEFKKEAMRIYFRKRMSGLKKKMTGHS